MEINNNERENGGNYNQYGVNDGETGEVYVEPVYPNFNPSPAPDPRLVEEEKSTFKRTVIKLAAFAAIIVLNNNFLFYIFYYPAIALMSVLSKAEAPLAVQYFISWLTNDMIAYLIPGLAAFLLFRKELAEKVRYSPHEKSSPFLDGILTFLSACFLGSLAGIISNFIASILDSLFGTGEIPDVIEGTLPPEGEVSSYWVMFIFVCIIAPVVEELIFRKLLLVPLRKHGDRFAVIITALLFGFYHGNFDQMPYAFVVGLLFGLLAVNTNSVVPCMIVHAVNNTAVTLGQYLTKVTGEVEPFISISNLVLECLARAFWIGIAATAVLISRKMFSPPNKSLLTAKERAVELFKNPYFYAFAAMTVLMMV